MADPSSSDPSRTIISSTDGTALNSAARPLFNTDIDNAPSAIVTLDTIDQLLTINNPPDHCTHSPGAPLALHQ